MSKTRKKKRKKTNILLGFVCILLAVLLGFILVTNYKTEQEESKHLSEIAGAQQNGIEDYEAVKKHADELEKTASEDTEDTDDSKSKNDKEKSAETEADTYNKENTDQAEDTTKETAAASGIVCWGDDLINGEESATYSYMAVLQKLLTENGYSNLTVINKPLQGGGPLSMMKMAGVSDDKIQGYITKHQQAANGAQLNVTETGIRDLTEEETTRNDLDCIPVIFMGYYGGWNHDPAELAEQQENILNTFQDKEEFLVVGTRPMDGTVTSDALDQVLSQKWGEHYISLASVTPQPASTKEAQQAMAEAILQKLEELNYISKN